MKIIKFSQNEEWNGRVRQKLRAEETPKRADNNNSSWCYHCNDSTITLTVKTLIIKKKRSTYVAVVSSNERTNAYAG